MATNQKLSELDAISAVADADTAYLLDSDDSGNSKKGTLSQVWTWIKTHLIAVDSDVIPDADNTRDCGATAFRWADIFAGGSLSDGTTTRTIADIVRDPYEMSEDITFATNNTYDVGEQATQADNVYARTYNGETAGASELRCYDFIHKAGQGTTPYLMGAHHDYTDGSGNWMDKVGSGTILNLNNANNSVQRPDKAADYVGTAEFLSCATWNGSSYDDTYKIKASGDHDFLSSSDSVSTITLTNTHDTDDGYYAFTFKSGVERDSVFNFMNGSNNLFEMISDTSNTRAVIRSASAQTGGLAFKTLAGSISYLTASSQYHRFYINLTERFQIGASSIKMFNLPTSDPSSTGALWNDSGTLKISL